MSTSTVRIARPSGVKCKAALLGYAGFPPPTPGTLVLPGSVARLQGAHPILV